MFYLWCMFCDYVVELFFLGYLRRIILVDLIVVCIVDSVFVKLWILLFSDFVCVVFSVWIVVVFVKYFLLFLIVVVYVLDLFICLSKMRNARVAFFNCLYVNLVLLLLRKFLLNLFWIVFVFFFFKFLRYLVLWCCVWW